METYSILSFSPRNGEVILKSILVPVPSATEEFQSPQWGSNSKVSGADFKLLHPEVSVPAMGK